MTTVIKDADNNDMSGNQSDTAIDVNNIPDKEPAPSNYYTSSSDDIRAGFASNTVHCLLPRPTRNGIIITTPKYVSKELLSAKVTQTLEEDMVNSSIFIVEINQSTNETTDETTNETAQNYIYDITFLTIPKQFINKLFQAGIRTVNCYIGFSENMSEYPLLNGEPDDKQIAMVNNEGKSCPYKATLKLNSSNLPP